MHPTAKISAPQLLPLLRAILVVVAALGFPLPLLSQDAPVPQRLRQNSLQLDFRGSRGPQKPWKLFGPDAQRLSKPEENGWRITLPADRQNLEPVGLVMTDPVQGNFEITAGYEILQADRPTSGGGVGFEMYLMLATPSQDAIAFYRINRKEEGEGFLCVRMKTVEGERTHQGEIRPATSKTGQLRVVRQGNEVGFWVADGEPTFRELFRYDLGAADLKMVRLGAYTARTPYPVDLRITDLKVAADQPAIDQPPRPAASSPGTPQSERRNWLVAAGIIALLIILTFLGLWFLARRLLRSETAAAQEPEAEARPVVRFACSGCGSSVKAWAELAGKRIKCPQCGHVVAVPGVQADDRDPISL